MPDVPIKDWLLEPIFDSSVYLDRPPVRYAGDENDGDGWEPWPDDEPLPDELPDA